jgi:hypothetical protein
VDRPLSRLYVHPIFSTKNREPLLLAALGGQTHADLASALNHRGSTAVKVGGTADHALFRLSKKVLWLATCGNQAVWLALSGVWASRKRSVTLDVAP